MILLVDHNLHSVGQALIKLFDRNHFIHDHVRLIAAAEIQTSLQHHDRVGFNVVTVLHKILRPKNATNRTLDVFKIEHRVLGRAVRISWVFNVSLLDRRNHAADADAITILAACQPGCFVRSVTGQFDFVRGQRMAGQVVAKDFFFAVKQQPFFPLVHRR